MSRKQLALKTIEDLPETVSWEDIEERIHFMAGVEKGLKEVREGKTIPHQQVRENLKEWLSQ